jgi:hypothetical protein
MVAITSYLFEDLVVVKNSQAPGTDIYGTPGSGDVNVPDNHHIILEKGTVGQVGYVRFEHIGPMAGEDWALLIGAAASSNLWDLNLQAPA